LEHCKNVCREANVAGGENAITTTVGQTGHLGRIVNYVKQAWIEVQNLHQHTGLSWRWMRVGFTLTTVDSQAEYSYGDGAIVDDLTATQIARFRNWMIKDYDDPPKIYLQSAGEGTEGWLTYIDWNDFKYLFRIGTQNDAFPAYITINPQNQIVLGPTPNGVYVISGDFMRGAQVFQADNDVPDLPESFEDVIMYRALSKYGLNRNAIEAITAGEDGYATYLGALEGDQLSEIPIGHPMA